MKWKAFYQYLWIGFLAANIGCGGEARLVVHPVQGSVTVMGKPTGGVALQFHPVGSDVRVFPRTVTAEDGSFQLSTYQPNDGVPEGDYLVTASWRQVDASADMEMHPDEVSLVEERLATVVTDPATTPLKVTVSAGRNVLPPFEINMAEKGGGKRKGKHRRSS